MEKFLTTATRILGKSRWDAEKILAASGFSLAESAEVVSQHVRARSKTVCGSPREVALSLINARSLSLRLA